MSESATVGELAGVGEFARIGMVGDFAKVHEVATTIDSPRADAAGDAFRFGGMLCLSGLKVCMLETNICSYPSAKDALMHDYCIHSLSKTTL